MSAKEIKSIYLSLKRNEDLTMMFPGMTGVWSKDKDKFIRQYNENNRLLNDTVDIDEIYGTEDTDLLI